MIYTPFIDKEDPDYVCQQATILFECIVKNDFRKAQFIIQTASREERRRVASSSVHGFVLLLAATQIGTVSIVRRLLNEFHADTEVRGDYESTIHDSIHHVTALWVAAAENKLKILKALRQKNADMNTTSEAGISPLLIACMERHLPAANYLISEGADIHLASNTGVTCLMAATHDHSLTATLIKKGANIRETDNQGNTALHYAINNRNAKSVKLLLKHGSDVAAKNIDGENAVFTAALSQQVNMLQILFDQHKSLLQHVEAYELMGASYAVELNDFSSAYDSFREAFSLRLEHNMPKKANTEATKSYYGNKSEVCTLHELREITFNHEALLIQSLLIYERQLGHAHRLTLAGQVALAKRHAHNCRYHQSFDLWMHVARLKFNNQETLQQDFIESLQALCELVCGQSTNPEEFDVEDIFEVGHLLLLFDTD